MLREEYELFRMDPGESIKYMHIHFLHFINKLDNFGKTFSNKDYANKILRSICSKWKPKVTTIKESYDLSSLDITKKFGKLKKHENELKLFTESKVKSKNKEKVK